MKPQMNAEAVSNSVFLELVVLTIEDGHLRILGGLPAHQLPRAKPLDQAAQRLLKQEITADHTYLEQLYTFAFRGGRVVVGYLALVRNAKLNQPGRAWHSTQKLSEVAAYGLKRLRNKITYTNLAFAFLPDRFTLSELQSTYEVVLERAVDKRNFRKKILSLDILTADGEIRRGGRPARLYRFTGPREVSFWPSFSPAGASRDS
jgi:8-oxo-dGTP diphosphatase